MKNFRSSKRKTFGPILAALLLLYQVAVEAELADLGGVFSSEFESSSSNDAELDQESSSKSPQEGSWSQWWSYDGISGPDYWNINKHWSLCTSGRKQSPIDIRTDRLVFDHLLGPIQLDWISFDQANNIIADLQALSSDESQKSLKVQLLNSGRGIEAWLEPSNSAPIETNSEFIISHGPLSYAYKLFKIELHSAANFPSQQIASPRARNNHAGSHAHPYKGDQKENSDLLAEEQVPEALKSGKSSEHLINGDSFEAELQLHFYNRHLASSSAQALQLAFESRPNLFATISVFIVTTKVKNNHQSGNNENNKKEKQQTANNNQSSPIDFILDNLNVIPNQGNLVELKLTRKHIESLITDRNHYITYQGSMNRPPCAENVDWILLNKAIKIDETKLEVIFEKLTTNQENIRPVKALHRRLLRTTISKLEFVPSTKENSASECGDDKQRRNCSDPHSPRQYEQTDSNRNEQQQQEIQSKRSWCNMKPNYAYQFSYGQKS